MYAIRQRQLTVRPMILIVQGHTLDHGQLQCYRIVNQEETTE